MKERLYRAAIAAIVNTVVAAALNAVSATSSMAAAIPVLTYHYDNTRSGANISETILTPTNVNMAQFGKLFSVPVDSGIYAQPLYVPNLSIPGLGVHNVVYVATQHNYLYAFDADNHKGMNGSPLWHRSFIHPGRGITTVSSGDVGCGDIVPEIGITGTPVIDAASGTIDRKS